jgi:hypothetical protein
MAEPNWRWDLRTDGGMDGIEFARCLTAGGHRRVLVHAAPARLAVEVRTEDGAPVAHGEVERAGERTPMTELILDGDAVTRREVWPDEGHLGLPVLLAGGEVGVLRSWHDDEHRWWRWTLELSNHADRPPGWSPP